MGGSSSSKKTTNYQTTNYQLNDQSFRDNSRTYEDSFNTYTDQGAIKAAFDFSGDTVNRALNNNLDTTNRAFDFSGDTVNRSLDTVDNAIRSVVGQSMQSAQNAADNALRFAENVSKTAIAPDSDTLKYGLIGAGLIAAAMVLK